MACRDSGVTICLGHVDQECIVWGIGVRVCSLGVCSPGFSVSLSSLSPLVCPTLSQSITSHPKP